LIRKMVEAKRSGATEVVCWGDGSPTREFLYVEDCADALVLAAERYNGADPVNLGSGEEIAIRDLVEMVAEMVGYTGRIVWDTSRPNGQPRRKLDITRAERSFGFTAKTALHDGLRRTIAWYLDAMPEAVPA
jgi:GDP-L-fucose synthase